MLLSAIGVIETWGRLMNMAKVRRHAWKFVIKYRNAKVHVTPTTLSM